MTTERPRRPRRLPDDARKSAVTYHRVSTSEQDATLARTQLRAAAKLRNLRVVAEFEETASGFYWGGVDRPKLHQVLAMAREGRIGWVLVWRLDRFGRSLIDIMNHLAQLERCGVTLVATAQGLEVGPQSGLTGQITAVVLAAAAQVEVERIREGTRMGMAAARARGVHIGRPRKKPAPEGTT